MSLLEVIYTCYWNSLKLCKNDKKGCLRGISSWSTCVVYQCSLVSITRALHNTSLDIYLPYNMVKNSVQMWIEQE